jgi:hypothetical protein
VSPKLFTKEEYRFRFFSNDYEPIHVHVVKGECEAIVEIEPIRVRRNLGFNERELQKLVDMIKERQNEIKEMWHEFFSN